MIALFAGRGDLPAIVAAALAGQGRPMVLCELVGQPSGLSHPQRASYRLESLVTDLGRLRAQGVTQACLAGALTRPVIDRAAIDAATAPVFAALSTALAQGDDGTLRALIAVIESAGIEVLGASDLVPDLLPPAGVLSRRQPDAAMAADAQRAEGVLRALAAADLGQACLVRQGQVLAVEAAFGTDWMLDSVTLPETGQGGDALTWALDQAGEVVGAWADWLAGPTQPAPAPRRPGPAQGALFVKAPKPGQDRRADLPVIGPQTVQRAARAGLSGLVIEAGGVMVLHRAKVVELADKAGLVLWVRPPT